MVRERQVGAAAVDVDRRAQEALGHRRAFDVPARPARPPWAGPGRLIRRLGLPEHKIKGMALVRVVRPVAARIGDGQHLGAWDVAQCAILGESIHVKVDAAVADVGDPSGQQLFHGADDPFDDVGRARG